VFPKRQYRNAGGGVCKIIGVFCFCGAEPYFLNCLVNPEKYRMRQIAVKHRYPFREMLSLCPACDRFFDKLADIDNSWLVGRCKLGDHGDGRALRPPHSVPPRHPPKGHRSGSCRYAYYPKKKEYYVAHSILSARLLLQYVEPPDSLLGRIVVLFVFLKLLDDFIERLSALLKVHEGIICPPSHT
jgi:hypothetical protein